MGVEVKTGVTECVCMYERVWLDWLVMDVCMYGWMGLFMFGHSGAPVSLVYLGWIFVSFSFLFMSL